MIYFGKVCFHTPIIKIFYTIASIIRSKILNYNSEKLKVSLNDHKLEFDTTTSKTFENYIKLYQR